MTPRDIVAKTLYGEARGEGYAGMVAVANVIMNRAAHPCWWGHDPASVCLKAYQFSCWNSDDPNRDKVFAVTEDDPVFVTALEIADLALDGALSDVTKGATHYKVTSLPWPRSWGAEIPPLTVIGHHSFYRITS